MQKKLIYMASAWPRGAWLHAMHCSHPRSPNIAGAKLRRDVAVAIKESVVAYGTVIATGSTRNVNLNVIAIRNQMWAP